MVDCNVFHTNESLFVFGCNDYDQLGLGDKKDWKYPTKLNINHKIILFNEQKLIKSSLSFVN